MDNFSSFISQKVHYWCVEMYSFLYIILISYPTTLSKVFIMSKSFVTLSLESFKYKIVSYADGIVWLLSYFLFFNFFITFISFPYVLSLAIISSIILNKSRESGHICVISYFRGNVLNIIPFCVVLAIHLSYRVNYSGAMC